jgi:hypothetical protein
MGNAKGYRRELSYDASSKRTAGGGILLIKAYMPHLSQSTGQWVNGYFNADPSVTASPEVARPKMPVCIQGSVVLQISLSCISCKV